MAKLKIVSKPAPSCNQCVGQNTYYNLKPGDYYIEEKAGDERSCIFCFCKNQPKKKGQRILKKIENDSFLRNKRARELMDWEGYRKKILTMVRYNYKRKEFDKKIKEIEYDCSWKTWEERLEEIENFAIGENHG